MLLFQMLMLKRQWKRREFGINIVFYPMYLYDKLQLGQSADTVDHFPSHCNQEYTKVI
jgi:hypothetical protein